MTSIKTIASSAAAALLLPLASCSSDFRTGLTLIPPGTITDKVDLDIRAGIVNNGRSQEDYEIRLYLNGTDEKSLLETDTVSLASGESHLVRHILDTEGMSGENTVMLKVRPCSRKHADEISRTFNVIKSDIRSTRLIDGAWAGIYHWSEQEGKHWNKDIRSLTDKEWREIVRSMHKIGMDIIVIQEVFRNNDYVGQHSTDVANYSGKAFYPSELYPGRMPIAAEDPVEAILSEADSLGMHVLPGVGMFAWFDFTQESLQWHKNVAKEVWNCNI